MYTFPGVFPFIERIAAQTGRNLHQVGRTRGLWHVSQVQDALGQLPRLDPASQAASLQHVREIRDGLELALAGVDAAIADATAGIGLLPEAEIPANSKPIRKRI